MHQYLSAIGFGQVHTQQELEHVLQQVKEEYSRQSIVPYRDGADYCEYRKPFGKHIGISVFGELDEKDNFYQTVYFPYYEGNGISTFANVVVEKRMAGENFVGIVEDPRIGISIIFHLQNSIDYLKHVKQTIGEEMPVSVTFTGLSMGGRILLPVYKEAENENQRIESSNKRQSLITAARSGDTKALETLTLEDMDTYSKVTKRLEKEDIFTIVNSYLMPYGVECDRYAILGEILSLEEIINIYSGEEVYQMRLDVNEMEMDVCIPKKCLYGEPAVGRRFKGVIWLQGRINY